jgi:hypothetical protein
MQLLFQFQPRDAYWKEGDVSFYTKVYCLLSAVCCQLSAVSYLLSSIYWLLSTGFCLLSVVSCLLSAAPLLDTTLFPFTSYTDSVYTTKRTPD